MGRKHVSIFTVLIFLLILFVEAPAGPLVIDHTAVDQYNSIPQYWIDQVKKMWVTVPGESHSSGYRIGLILLETAESKFQVNILESGTPEGQTDQYLRFSRATRGDVTGTGSWRYSYGEEDWYTSRTAIDNTKVGITYCNTTGPVLTAMGFGWCWDMTWHNGVGGTEDSLYRVRWAGSSVGGPDGDLRWGLDADDSTLTGNHVCMDTYLQATQEYINHCTSNGYPTKIFFTTGPIDGSSGEAAYQRYLKHEHIRNYVRASSDGILFDYADILSWSNAGVQNTQNWTDNGGTPHTFQYIHSDNMLDLDGTYAEDGDHIGKRGALRLGKAIWYMLARMAGWDGMVPVQLTSFTATTQGMNTELHWFTATEVNNYGFDIERRKIGTEWVGANSWEKIGFVSGFGTSNSPHEYSYSDSRLLSGRYLYRLKQIDNDAVFHYSQNVEVEVGVMPQVFNLSQNYPNPFNPATIISYQVPVNSKVSLKVIDLLGKEIATLVNEVKPAGSYIVTFDGTRFSSGLYFYTIESSNQCIVKKMLMLK